MEQSLINDFFVQSAVDTSMVDVGLGFLLSTLLSYLTRYFYINHSYSLTGKQHIANIIPTLALIVFLVIVVVKSSLALSLGLVGALSIVRFRTPIKEPEELIYLFLAIAIGLGNAAGHFMFTSIIVVSILVIALFYSESLKGKSSLGFGYMLNINWSSNNLDVGTITDEISPYFCNIKLIRYEKNTLSTTLVLLVDSMDDFDIDAVIGRLTERDQTVDISFFEGNPNW